jgi:hypothetical protein
VIELWLVLSYVASFGVGVVLGVGLAQRYRILWWFVTSRANDYAPACFETSIDFSRHATTRDDSQPAHEVGSAMRSPCDRRP